MMTQRSIRQGAALAAMMCVAAGAGAQTVGRGAVAPRAANGCAALPTHAALKIALDKATADEKSGLNNHMWATVVDRDGVVCAVAFSGTDRFAQWGGSRVISAQKASTAAAFNLDAASSSNGSGQAH